MRAGSNFRRALQLRATASESCRGSRPHLPRTHVVEDGSQRSDPAPAAHRHMVGDARPHADLAAALEVNRANMQLLPHPPRHGQVGSGLDGDIVLDGEQVQRSGELHGVRAVNVCTHGRSEPAQATHAMSGAPRNIVLSGRRTERSSRPIHQVRRCIRLHLGYTPGATRSCGRDRPCRA